MSITATPQDAVLTFSRSALETLFRNALELMKYKARGTEGLSVLKYVKA